MDDSSFFVTKTEALLILQNDIQQIERGIINSLEFSALDVDTIVFSANGYGNGLAKLDEMYPEVYKWLHRKIANMVLTFGGQEEYEKLNFIDSDEVSILAGKEF